MATPEYAILDSLNHVHADNLGSGHTPGDAILFLREDNTWQPVEGILPNGTNSNQYLGWNNSTLLYEPRQIQYSEIAGSPAPFATPLTTKGDIYTRNGSGDTRLPIGTDGYILMPDHTTSTGLVWHQVIASDVNSWLGYSAASQSTTITINGTAFDLSTNRTWSVGTVTSVGISGSDFTIGSPISTSGNISLTLATVNTNTGTYGSATQVGQFTVNGKGLITAAGNVSIQITESQVTNLTADLATLTANTSFAHINITGTGGAGYVDLAYQASAPSSPSASHTYFYANSTGNISWKQTDGYVRTIDGVTNLTASRTYKLPDVAGTFVLISSAGTAGQALVSGGAGTAVNTWFAPTATSVIIAGTGGILSSDAAFTYGTNVLRIYNSGTNVWVSTQSVIRLGGVASYMTETASATGNTSHFTHNAYFTTGSVWKYLVSEQASNYFQALGKHVFRVAVSGTADATITWNTVMTINNNSNISINTTNSTVDRFIIDANSASVTGVSLMNSNGSSTVVGMQFLDNVAAVGVFTGFKPSTGQYKVNNIYTSGFLDFQINGTSAVIINNDRSLNFNKKIAAYNGITTAGWGVPAIHESVNQTGLSADIATTNLTNSGTAGQYALHYTIEDTVADISVGVGTVTLTISWTDGAGATTVTATQALTGLGRSSGTFHVQLATGNITYAVSHTGLFGSAAYALYITCQRLN